MNGTMNGAHEGHEVPFYSQKVNWADEDSGFPNSDEVARWESNSCGIACVRMVVKFFTDVEVRYWDLLQHGLQLNAYNEVGWIHAGLVKLAADYGVRGTAHRGRKLDSLVESTEKASICIASVSAGFRGGLLRNGSSETFPRGGHLVVAYKNVDGKLSCNHPSTLDAWNRKNWVVELEAWEHSFSGGFMEFGVPN